MNNGQHSLEKQMFHNLAYFIEWAYDIVYVCIHIDLLNSYLEYLYSAKFSNLLKQFPIRLSPVFFFFLI